MKGVLDPVSSSRFGQKCAAHIPSLPNSPRKQRLVKAVNFSPFSNAFALAIEFNKYIVFCVALLRFYACPPAVLMEISKRPINAVYGASIRALSHVVQKILENKPSIANMYPSRAILLIFGVAGFRTATNHVYPSVICFGMDAAKSVAVREPIVPTPTCKAAINATPSTTRACVDLKFGAANWACSDLFHSFILQQNNFKGKPLAGLTKRRQAEYEQCKGDA